MSPVVAAIDHSFCIAVYCASAQIAFARLITDFATFAYLTDVYVLEEHRGKGLASVMLAHLQEHPRLQGLRRWLLFTVDAQAVYEKAGWTTYSHPDRVMIRDNPDDYA